MTGSHPRFPDLPTELPPHLQNVMRLSPALMTLGLGNIRALLDRLGRPEEAFRTVVVAGTNGKGSVTAMTASLLHAQGMRVGRYISPHVYSVTERIAVDNEPIALSDMEEAAGRVMPLRDEMEFSYFEALTAIAFLVFAARGVEVAVLETGLGGRFDATNVTRPLVTVLTSIALDHRRVLGDTEEEILREKLGIMRPGVPLLIGAFTPGLRAIIAEAVARRGAELVDLPALGTLTPLSGLCARIETPLCDYGEVTLPFAGSHQRINALLAVGAAERVAGRLTHLADGLARTYLPARLERIERGGRAFILDVAHNDAALATAAGALYEISPERARNAVVLGLMKRKELESAPARLVGAARRLYLVTPDPFARGGQDAFSPQELYARHFHALVGARPSSLTDSGTDAILWNRTGREEQWGRLLDGLLAPENPVRTFLVAGSHHVVDQFGRALMKCERD